MRRLSSAAVLLALVWMSPAGMPADAAGDDAAARLQDVKSAALDAAIQAEDAQQSLRWPGEPPLDLYLVAADSGASPLSIAVTADGAALGEQRFSPLAAAALSAGGWCRVAQLVSGQAHRIHVEVMLGADGNDPQAAPRTLEADLSTTAAAAVSVVAVLDSSLIGSPSLRLLGLQPADAKPGLARRLLSALPAPPAVQQHYVAGGRYDPVLRHALFLRETRHYLEAAVRLRRYGAGGELDPHYQLALARAYLDLGMPSAALALEPRWRADEAVLAQELRRDIAAWYYRRGDYGPAETALGTRPARRRSAELLAWQDLKARILLAQGRMNDALTVLGEAEPEAGFAGYVRYFNFGVAEVASGNVAQGLTVLDRIGDIASGDPAMTALSDRANLAAGAHFLDQGQGATAIPLLEKVHDRGADSNAALLDLGWAWLAPAGAEQSRGMVGDERTVGAPPESRLAAEDSKWDQNLYQRFTLDPFERATVESSQDGRLRHALAIWGELASRPQPDDAVTEATLAIAVQLDEAGAAQAAAGWYERCIAALEQSLSDLAQAERYIGGAQAQADVFAPPPDQAYDRDLHNLPPPPTADTLRADLAGWPFLQRLADYRDAVVLDRELGEISDALHTACTADAGAARACNTLPQLLGGIASLRLRLDALTPALQQRLEQPLLQSLSAQRSWQTKLLTDARLALARLHDRPTQEPH